MVYFILHFLSTLVSITNLYSRKGQNFRSCSLAVGFSFLGLLSDESDDKGDKEND